MRKVNRFPGNFKSSPINTLHGMTEFDNVAVLVPNSYGRTKEPWVKWGVDRYV